MMLVDSDGTRDERIEIDMFSQVKIQLLDDGSPAEEPETRLQAVVLQAGVEDLMAQSCNLCSEATAVVSKGISHPMPREG